MREDCEILEALVGFRVYYSQAERIEENTNGEEVRYDGKGTNEWIPVYSPRIQPHCY